MPDRRRTFGPVVLLGLAGAGLAAIAGNKSWLEVNAPGGSCPPAPGFDYATLAREAPLAGALALVLLAAWGVLLVTRGRFRRVIAGLAALAAVGYLVTAIEAYWSLKRAALEDAVAAATSQGAGCPAATVHMNDWWLLALLVGAMSVVAALAAVRFAPSWPEMGTRYDSPQGEAAPAEPEGNLELWKALDEGHDPTEPDRPLD